MQVNTYQIGNHFITREKAKEIYAYLTAQDLKFEQFNDEIANFVEELKKQYNQFSSSKMTIKELTSNDDRITETFSGLFELKFYQEKEFFTNGNFSNS